MTVIGQEIRKLERLACEFGWQGMFKVVTILSTGCSEVTKSGQVLVTHCGELFCVDGASAAVCLCFVCGEDEKEDHALQGKGGSGNASPLAQFCDKQHVSHYPPRTRIGQTVSLHIVFDLSGRVRFFPLFSLCSIICFFPVPSSFRTFAPLSSPLPPPPSFPTFSQSSP